MKCGKEFDIEAAKKLFIDAFNPVMIEFDIVYRLTGNGGKVIETLR